MDISNFDVSDSLSIEGQWVPIGRNARLKIARMNNERYRKYIKTKTKPYQSAIRAGTVDDELMIEIVVQAMARTILLDWEGLTENKAPIPYTVEKAEELLRNKEPFRELVASLANDQQLFQEEEVADGEKNS